MNDEEARECTNCHGEMWSGYVINDGMEYFCCDDCLHGWYSPDEYEELCECDAAYWTEWY